VEGRRHLHRARHPLRVEPDRHADRGLAGEVEGGRPGRPIAPQRLARADRGLVGGEGSGRGRGGQHEVVALVEAGHGVRRFDPQRLGAEEVHGAHARLALRQLRQAGVEQFPPLVRDGGHQAGQPHAPDSPENRAGVRQARVRLLHDRARLLQHPRRAGQRFLALRVKRRVEAKAAHQRDAQAGHAVLDARRQSRARRQAERVAEVGLRHGGEHQRRVAHRSRHRPATATPEKAPCGHCGTRP
jgi:hypothetical protein